MVIVESKHHATKEEIDDKTRQIPNLQNWIDQEKKYYEISKNYHQCVEQQKQIKKDLKILRRRIRRGNTSSNVSNTIENKNQALCRLVESETLLEDDLDQEIEKNNWHKNFMKTLQSQNLQFEISGNRYQVKPEKITV